MTEVTTSWTSIYRVLLSSPTSPVEYLVGALVHDKKVAIAAERYGVRSLKSLDASILNEEGYATARGEILLSLKPPPLRGRDPDIRGDHIAGRWGGAADCHDVGHIRGIVCSNAWFEVGTCLSCSGGHVLSFRNRRLGSFEQPSFYWQGPFPPNMLRCHASTSGSAVSLHLCRCVNSVG